VLGKKGFDVASQGGVVRADLCDVARSFLGKQIDRSLKNFFNFLPAFRGHVLLDAYYRFLSKDNLMQKRLD
jgi:hypothetical protein